SPSAIPYLAYFQSRRSLHGKQWGDFVTVLPRETAMKIAHAFLVAVFSVTSYANAVVITADFEAIPLGINATNYNEAGFTFSPNCHFDGVAADFPDGASQWMGFDAAGCA